MRHIARELCVAVGATRAGSRTAPELAACCLVSATSGGLGAVGAVDLLTSEVSDRLSMEIAVVRHCIRSGIEALVRTGECIMRSLTTSWATLGARSVAAQPFGIHRAFGWSSEVYLAHSIKQVLLNLGSNLREPVATALKLLTCSPGGADTSAVAEMLSTMPSNIVSAVIDKLAASPAVLGALFGPQVRVMRAKARRLDVARLSMFLDAIRTARADMPSEDIMAALSRELSHVTDVTHAIRHSYLFWPAEWTIPHAHCH